MKELTVKTGNGRITINIDHFFPCSKARFSKLIKIARGFSWLNNVQEMAEQLNAYFRERIQRLEGEKAAHGKLYLQRMQEHADYRDMVESGKRPNGIPLKKEELKEFKKLKTSSMRSAKGHPADAKKIDREITALKGQSGNAGKFGDVTHGRFIQGVS